MEDSSIGHKNKIEEKQEDMFDAHKYQQNPLDQTDNTHNPHNFMDFGEEDITTEGLQSQATSELKKEAEGQQPRNKRKRGKRDVKKFDSDEDNIEEKQEEKVEKN